MPPHAATDAHAALPALLILGGLVLAGYYLGRAVKRVNLPSILGFMLTGLLAGPSLLGFVTHHDLDVYNFINEIALGFVAITIGSELNLKVLGRQGRSLFTIIVGECVGTFLLVLLLLGLVLGDWPLALLFGAIAAASAPAGTVAVIQEYRAKGPLTTTLYAVVGFDDGLAIILFGFAFGTAKALLPAVDGASGGFVDVLVGPAREIGLSLAVGAALGLVFCNLVRRVRNSRDHLILAFGFVLVATGLSELWHMSLILTNMVVGFVLVNTRNRDLVERVSNETVHPMPLMFILFFALAGAHLDLAVLPTLGVISALYVVGRMVGKVGGSWIGARVGNAPDTVRRWLGWGLHTQAGVAVGLALIVKTELDGIARRLAQAGQVGDAEHVAWIAGTVVTTITATCIFFEVVGPILAHLALKNAGEIPEDAPA